MTQIRAVRDVASEDGDDVRLSLRMRLGHGVRLGPGKIRLLEAIDDTGSISAAARSMGMSYRRAWLLVDSINQAMAEPVVESHSGGARGGGARLTPGGHEIIRLYKAMEEKALQAVATELDALGALARASD